MMCWLDICKQEDFNPRIALLTVSRHTADRVKVLIALLIHAIYDLRNFVKYGGRMVRDYKAQIVELMRSGSDGSPYSERVMSGVHGGPRRSRVATLSNPLL